MYSHIVLFSRYVWSSYSLLVSVLDASNTVLNKTESMPSGVPRGGNNHSRTQHAFIKLLPRARHYAKHGDTAAR